MAAGYWCDTGRPGFSGPTAAQDVAVAIVHAARNLLGRYGSLATIVVAGETLPGLETRPKGLSMAGVGARWPEAEWSL
jgi:hypothetical protein